MCVQVSGQFIPEAYFSVLNFASVLYQKFSEILIVCISYLKCVSALSLSFVSPEQEHSHDEQCKAVWLASPQTHQIAWVLSATILVVAGRHLW